VRLATAIGCALGGLAAASGAHAGALFDAYQTMCVAHAGDAAATLAIADRQHWDVMPAAALASYEKQGFSEVAGRGDRKTRIAVVTGREKTSAGDQPMHIQMCAVMGFPTTEGIAATPAEFKAWLGPLTPDSDGVYFFTEEIGGAHRDVPFRKLDNQELKALLGGKRARTAALNQAGELTTLIYGAVWDLSR
jgi:hypothetical protein